MGSHQIPPNPDPNENPNPVIDIIKKVNVDPPQSIFDENGKPRRLYQNPNPETHEKYPRMGWGNPVDPRMGWGHGVGRLRIKHTRKMKTKRFKKYKKHKKTKNKQRK